MAYDERAVQAAPAHNITLEGRERLTVSGVSDVGSYDENLILMSTSHGELTVHGIDLHIEKLSLDTGDLLVRGTVTELAYEEPAVSGSLWSRLFK
jgi:sporulation protein YabP